MHDKRHKNNKQCMYNCSPRFSDIRQVALPVIHGFFLSMLILDRFCPKFKGMIPIPQYDCQCFPVILLTSKVRNKVIQTQATNTTFSLNIAEVSQITGLDKCKQNILAIRLRNTCMNIQKSIYTQYMNFNHKHSHQ